MHKWELHVTANPDVVFQMTFKVRKSIILRGQWTWFFPNLLKFTSFFLVADGFLTRDHFLIWNTVDVEHLHVGSELHLFL